MNAEICEFDAAKQSFLRFAQTLEKANDPAEFRALLLADAAAPYHSYDMLALIARTECIGETLAELISRGLDADGAPEQR